MTAPSSEWVTPSVDNAGETVGPDEHARDQISSRFAYGLVALSVGFGLWTLRGERNPVAYPNDSSVHSLTVAYARLQWTSGHFPLDGWFPYLSLGSPFFLHYQSTPAMLTGLVALAVGSAHAFGWSLYLLLAGWPISVYFGGRLFLLSRWQAAAAAAISPLVMSVTGYGFEHQAYDWLGNGLWPQLFGMWMLPLAWGYSWQAVSANRHRFGAVLTLAATIAFHFLTAYLAGVAVILWVLLRPTEILRRVGRAALISAGALAATLWITIPIVVDSKWGAINEFQVGRFWDDSYGARRILSWLVEGKLYDSGRFPIITILVGVGIVSCLLGLPRYENARAVLGVWVLSMLLYFGRPTLGAVLDHLPGQQNLFFQRFNTGVDLAGIYLAGIGLGALANGARVAVPRFGPPVRRWILSEGAAFVTPALGLCLAVACLTPAWIQINQRGNADAYAIGYQRGVDKGAGNQLDSLLAIVRRANDGRVYAGLPSNWGANFRVGEVPVYVYLADEGIDAVGFTLRTSSLMTGPEAYFDDAVAGDFPLFGIHYILLPTGDVPDVPSNFVARQGPYSLWTVGGGGYFQVVDTQGSITADNANLGARTGKLLASKLPGEHVLPTVAYAGTRAAAPTLGADLSPNGSPGAVTRSSANLTEGKASAVVDLNRQAVVLLSASYDPGWKVTVDEHRAKTEMVAPALVGVTVGPGVHTVSFSYAATGDYPELLAIGAAVVVVAAVGLTGLGGRALRRRRRRSPGG